MKSASAPNQWLEGRLVFLPKGEKLDTQDPKAYRPILVTQTIYRLFMFVIERKLKDGISFSSYQKGFANYDRCTEHSFTLQEILDDSRKRKKKVCLTWLDMQKTFDTVPHFAVEKIMEIHGFPEPLQGFIRSIYIG